MAGAKSWVSVEGGHQVLTEYNNGEGDCLFLAVSQQVDGELSGPQLRQLAVDYLTEHRADFEEELLSLGWDMIDSREIPIPLEGDLLIDGVLQTLSNPHTWAGAECLAAMSLALNREIRVYQEDGQTIVFPGDGQTIRLLLRYPRGAGVNSRRTHYQSVLHWRARAPAPPPLPGAVTRDVTVQTDGPSSSGVQTDGSSSSAVQTDGSSSSAEASNQNQCAINHRRSDSAMVLRSRQGLPSNNDYLRNENFSDEEECQADDIDASFKKCFMCRRNIARYALIPCGKFPACGTCIRTWYVNMKGIPCSDCRGVVAGWT